MSVITFDVYKDTLKKHDGFIPSNTEKNYTKLLFRFKENDDWSKCNIITASFFISAEDIVKSDAELMKDDLTATFSIPEEFTGEKGELNLSLQSSYTDENGKSVTLATNIVTLNRNNGIMVKEGANAKLYEKIILLVQQFFNNDKELIVDFIDEVNEVLSRLYTNNEIDVRLSGKLDNIKGSVTTGNLADSSVTTTKIADDSIKESHIKNYAVATEKLADGAVTTDKIEFGAVGKPELSEELQEEIDSNTEQIPLKLNKPASEGESGKVLASDGKGGTYWSPLKENILSNILILKNSENLFDHSSCEVLAAYVDSKIVAGRIHSTVYVPCEPNTTYTVSRQLLAQRFVVGETSVKPEIGVTVNQKLYNASGYSIPITTSATAKYLVIFYHKSDIDTYTEQEVREGLMVRLGTTAGDYVPYHTYAIAKNALPSEIQVLPEEVNFLSNEVDRILVNNRFKSKSKIFGVAFDLSSDSSKGERIADAVDLKNDYVVANTYQNGGVNDFDNVFPWCDIRKCNVKISDGVKTVTYEGESNFALDGSNGDVMVEIPKFYSFRERVGNSEIWAITGEPKSGFTVEPAFVVDGKEIDYIYVAAYNWADERKNDAVSCSGSNPENLISLHTLRTVAEGRGMSILDIATIHAIQMLYTIEFADRDNKAYMAGFGEAPYLKYSNSPVLETLSDTNVVTVTNSKRAANLRVGQRIKLCDNTTLRSTSHHITKVELNEDTQVITITFDSKDEDVYAGVTYISSVPQTNGDCDDMIYHTGRISNENNLSVFKYRHIENLWGNVWEMVDGIRVKNLNYYYTYDKTKYADETVDSWEKYPIPAPEQPYLGDDGLNRAWITDIGYNINNRLPILPSSCGSDGGVGKYYSAGIYTNHLIDRNGNTLDPDTEWMCVWGGGWDHNVLCSPFTFRFFSIALNGGTDILHSTRIVLR